VPVLTWPPVTRPAYRVGVPDSGYYQERLNSDASIYGGSNSGNSGGVWSEAVPAHGHNQSIVLTLPPLAALWLRAAR
jgi:1,4-alpha-glucan branching enzyme